MVMELAQNGDLFDVVAKAGRFSENTARYFFKQIIEGLDNLHFEHSMCHLDMKLENILVDDQFNAKITDFGFVRPTHSCNSQNYVGTKGYQSPEIVNKREFDGKSADVFALGVILFSMVFGAKPFVEASAKDNLYRPIANNNFDNFWKFHCKHMASKEKFVSNDLKDLIMQMLQSDQVQRISLNDIFGHSWLKCPIITKEEVVEELSGK